MSRQLFETQMAQVAGLTAAERQSHADKLVLLQQEALAIRQKGADALQIDEATALAEKAKAYEAINKQVTELSAHEITALDKAIAAQKLHNAEIGKTAEQKDLERAAIEAAGTAQMQTDADAIRSAANSAGEYKNIYVDRANALAHEIAQRKELAALIGEAAIKEKNVAAIKEQEKAYKDMWSTVEHTGKDVFVQVFSNGKNAFEGIGRALKASVIDLLYQMTLKKWIINVGVAATGGASSSSFAGGMGDAGSLFSAGSSLSNLFSSGSSLSNLFSSGGGMAALPGSAPIMATDVAANVAAGGSGLAAGSGIMSSLSAAAPYVAAAYMAYSLLSGSKEGPASGTGYRASGTVAASGATGSGFSLATNGSSNFADQWGVGELSAYAKLGNVDAQYKVLQGQAAQIASGLGATAASVSGMSIPFSISTGMVGAAGIGAAITQSMVDNFPQATIKALQGSAMPDYLGKFFDALVPSSLTTTDANSALQFAQQMKQVHDSLLETRSPLEVMRAQMADMAKALGTSADAYKHDFAAAIENGISQSVFTQWQQLGTAIDNVSKATTPLTQNLESSMNLFASRIEYDRLIGRIKGGSVAAPANNDELVAELRAMRAELAALRSASEKTADNTRSTAAVLDSVTGGGGPMLVQTA
ncbi:MAG TPA: hypothetical protein VFQ99_04175 [Gallionella sp.]|nr:hypothetical protein [Gallionella sp.]